MDKCWKGLPYSVSSPYLQPHFELSCFLYVATWQVKCQGGAWWTLSSWMAAPVCLAPRQDDSKLSQVCSPWWENSHRHTTVIFRINWFWPFSMRNGLMCTVFVSCRYMEQRGLSDTAGEDTQSATWWRVNEV